MTYRWYNITFSRSILPYSTCSKPSFRQAAPLDQMICQSFPRQTNQHRKVDKNPSVPNPARKKAKTTNEREQRAKSPRLDPHAGPHINLARGTRLAESSPSGVWDSLAIHQLEVSIGTLLIGPTGARNALLRHQTQDYPEFCDSNLPQCRWYFCHDTQVP